MSGNWMVLQTIILNTSTVIGSHADSAHVTQGKKLETGCVVF